jgi:hypothetical protein
MQVLYKWQLDMDVVGRRYRLLKRQSGMVHHIELGWHEEMERGELAASTMYKKDINLVIGSIERHYDGSGADLIMVKGAIDRGLALSKRLFVCKTYAFRKLE